MTSRTRGSLCTSRSTVFSRRAVPYRAVRAADGSAGPLRETMAANLSIFRVPRISRASSHSRDRVFRSAAIFAASVSASSPFIAARKSGALTARARLSASSSRPRRIRASTRCRIHEPGAVVESAQFGGYKIRNPQDTSRNRVSAKPIVNRISLRPTTSPRNRVELGARHPLWIANASVFAASRSPFWPFCRHDADVIGRWAIVRRRQFFKYLASKVGLISCRRAALRSLFHGRIRRSSVAPIQSRRARMEWIRNCPL